MKTSPRTPEGTNRDGRFAPVPLLHLPLSPILSLMAFYLVEATPRSERLDELEQKLAVDAFADLRPFGPTISHSLRNSRRRPDGTVVWEEEDYCSPPLAQERAAVLDDHFQSIEVEPVAKGDGWARIEDLPPLFPDLADETRV